MTKHCLHEPLNSSGVFHTRQQIQTNRHAQYRAALRDRLPHVVGGESAGEYHLVTRKGGTGFARQTQR
jgi:hypothetical protein